MDVLGVWLFLSVLLIVVVFLAVRSAAFRKVILVVFVAGLAGVGWLYYQSYYQNIETEKREARSWRLIRADEIVLSDMVLGQSSGFWTVKGNVTNRSSHVLSGFKLKIVVWDCPSEIISCPTGTTIGEDLISTYVSVPPNQKRAFNHSVSLRDMPQPAKLGWSYSVQEVRADVK